MSRRALFLPRVVMSPMPAAVVSKVPTESPDTFFETVMTPAEARRYAMDLLIDADRAERHKETLEWLAKHPKK
jgi:hypothetical protein